MIIVMLWWAAAQTSLSEAPSQAAGSQCREGVAAVVSKCYITPVMSRCYITVML